MLFVNSPHPARPDQMAGRCGNYLAGGRRIVTESLQNNLSIDQAPGAEPE
jgi:hypothetical protein